MYIGVKKPLASHVVNYSSQFRDSIYGHAGMTAKWHGVQLQHREGHYSTVTPLSSLPHHLL